MLPQGIFKKMATSSSKPPPRMSIESGPFTFHYLVDAGDVCYLTLTEKAYPKKLAFQYLEELASEFSRLYADQIEGVTRPYAFIKFGARGRAGSREDPCVATVGGGCCPACLQSCRVCCIVSGMLPGLLSRLSPSSFVLPRCLNVPWRCPHHSPPADTFIQKTKKLYLDTRTQRNIAKLNADIAEVRGRAGKPRLGSWDAAARCGSRCAGRPAGAS